MSKVRNAPGYLKQNVRSKKKLRIKWESGNICVHWPRLLPIPKSWWEEEK